MSKRIMAESSSKRSSASDLVSSVLPVPVGPRKKKEPIGFFGSLNPLRDSIMASARVVIALFCPLTRSHSFVSIPSRRSFSCACIFPMGIPVSPATTASTSSGETACMPLAETSASSFNISPIFSNFC